MKYKKQNFNNSIKNQHLTKFTLNSSYYNWVLEKNCDVIGNYKKIFKYDYFHVILNIYRKKIFLTNKLINF